VRGLHLVTMPLTPLRFTGVAASVILLAAGYCLAHGFVTGDEINLPRTLAWAVASTLPWACAWEALKRLNARPAWGVRCVLSLALLVAALVVSVGLEYALSAIYSGDSDSFAEVMYRLLPIPLGIAVARRLVQSSGVRVGMDPRFRGDDGIAGDGIAGDGIAGDGIAGDGIGAHAASPAERLRKLQIERVLDVPTRRGMLAVRISDIEHVRAAGNYVELVTADRTLLLRTTLQCVGEQLGAVGFVRVHRSLLVNASHVLAVRRGSRTRRIVKLRSGTELPIGRQFSDHVDTFLRAPPP
jgi:hypothetical protein